MFTLFLNGTVGAGKTSVADALGDKLGLLGVANAVLDFDWLRRAWPAPIDDRFNLRLGLRNAGALVRNFEESGAKVIVVAGVIEDAAQRQAHEAVFANLWSCRLTASNDSLEARLRSRHAGDEAARDWHLFRARQLRDILDRADLDDEVVDTDSQTVGEVADEILRRVEASRTRSACDTL